jgi:hypothetical protein
MMASETGKRLKAWATFVFATLAFVYATVDFFRSYVYVRDDLQATVIGEVDARETPPSKTESLCA